MLGHQEMQLDLEDMMEILFRMDFSLLRIPLYQVNLESPVFSSVVIQKKIAIGNNMVITIQAVVGSNLGILGGVLKQHFR